MKLDDEEKEIFCKECSGYLYSMSIHDPGPDLVACPMQRDPSGHCTGRPKRPASKQSRTEPQPQAQNRPIDESPASS